MDSNDQERERGITILAKCTSVLWHGAAGETRINIIDTPGPRRLRRRGGAHPGHGRWLPAAGRRRGRRDAADQVRARQGAEAGPEADRGAEQGRPRQRRSRPRCSTTPSTSSPPWAPATSSSWTSRIPTPAASGGLGGGRPGRSARPAWRRSSTCIVAHIAARRRRRPVPASSAQLLAVLIEADPFLGRVLTGRVESGRLAPGMSIRALSRDGKEIERGHLRVAGVPAA